MNKSFLLLWISQILSQVTIHTMNFLLLTRIFNVTNSPIASSFLWISYSLPTIFFGPLGAVFVDIFSRKKVLVLANFLQMVTILTYLFTFEQSIYYVYFVVFVYSILNQFYVPAEMSLLPSLVNKNNYAKANSMFFVTQQLSLLVGFGLSGLVLNVIGFQGTLIASSLMLFIATVSVLLLPNTSRSAKLPNTFENLLRTFFKKIIEGYLFIKERKPILYPLLILLFIQVGLSVVIIILPLIATQIAKVDISLSGLYVVVPASIGALIGTIAVNKLLKRKKVRKKTLLEIGMFLLAISTLSLNFVNKLAPISTLVIGLGFVLVNIPTLSYLQEVTPNWLRGRVFGNLFFLITIITLPLVFSSGVITEFFGIKTLLTILSLTAIILLVFSIKKGQKIIEENF